MAGLDCAEVSVAAWPSLRDGIHGTVTVDRRRGSRAMRELAAAGPGDRRLRRCAARGAARAGRATRRAAELRDAVALGPATRVLLIATEARPTPSTTARSSAERAAQTQRRSPKPRATISARSPSEPRLGSIPTCTAAS